MNKTMIKRLFTIVILFASLTAVAQTTTRLGITAGVNYNQMHFKQSDIADVDRGFGPHVGITGEMNIPGVGFAVDLSLLYSMYSSKLYLGEWKVWASQGVKNKTYRMHNIDIPVNLKFKYRKLNGFENTLKPMVYFGPTFSINVAGTDSKTHIKYNRLCTLLHVGVGVELFNRFQISGAYSFAVGESFHTRVLDENAAKNRCWSITMSYFFKD